jgi:hypothetical protein
MYLLAQPRRGAKSEKPCSCAEDDDAVELILEGVLGVLDEGSMVPGFVNRVFLHLGLVGRVSVDDAVPTAQLRRLAAERRQDQRDRRLEAKSGLDK